MSYWLNCHMEFWKQSLPNSWFSWWGRKIKKDWALGWGVTGKGFLTDKNRNPVLLTALHYPDLTRETCEANLQWIGGCWQCREQNKGTKLQKSQTLKNLTQSLANLWASSSEIIYLYYLRHLVPILTYSQVDCLRMKMFIMVNKRNLRKTFANGWIWCLGRKKTSWQNKRSKTSLKYQSFKSHNN